MGHEFRFRKVTDTPQPEIQASRFKSQVNSAKLLGANGV